MEDEQYINIESGLSVGECIESGLSVGAIQIVDKYEIFTEEEIYNINGKVPELDERVGIIEDEIEEINSSLDNIPTKVSQLTNDSGYLTQHQDLSDYAKKSDLEVKADKSYVDSAIESIDVSSQLTNYATKTDLSLKVDKETGKSLISDSEIERLSTLKNYDDTEIKDILNNKANVSDLHSHTNKTVLDGITSYKVNEWNSKSDFSGNYNDLTNKPTIPTKTSQLTNDSGFITTVPSEYVTESELNNKGYLTQHQDISGKVDKINGYSLVSDAEISRLSTLENYDDTDIKNSLNSKANKTELHSHSNKSVLDGITSTKITEWNNKSDFSGNYNDLTNKPTIPTPSNYKTAYGTCSTPAETSEKVVVIDDPNWKLEVGNIVGIRHTYSNTASNVTINVNNTGAYPIWYANTQYNGESTTYVGYANRTNTYMFTGTHWQWISNGVYPNNPTNASLGQGYGTCTTAESTLAKACTISSYSLTVGGIVSIKFTNAVPANSTLNIRTRGAKNIFYRGVAITDGIIKAGDTATFIYDGTQYHLISLDNAVGDIPTKTSQLINDSGFITTVPSEYITESELNNKGYLTSVPSEYVTETELNTALEQFNPNSLQQIPLYANSIEECVDTTKCYVLPDGFIYAYKETTVEIEPPEDTESPDYNPNDPAYTNLLPSATSTDRTTIYNGVGYKTNYRLSSSGGETSYTNMCCSGFIPCKPGDTLRVKGLGYIDGVTAARYIISYDSSNTKLKHIEWSFDPNASLANGYSYTTYKADNYEDWIIEVPLTAEKFGDTFNAIRFSNNRISDISIVTINQEIKTKGEVQDEITFSGNLVDTCAYTLNARYNSSNALKQTDAEKGYVAFDYIDIKKGDILRFKSTTRGYYHLGGSLLLWGNYPRLRFFNANNQLVASGGNDSTPIKNFFKCVDEGDNTTAIYVGYKADGTLYDDADQIAKTRFTIQVAGDDLSAVTEVDMQNVKITINIPMSELDNVLPPEGNTQVVMKWSNTGHAFVPNENYDNLIADMKNITDEHSKDIVYLKAITNSEDSTSGLSDSEKIARIKNWDMPIYENSPVFLLEENKPGWIVSNLTNDKLIEMYDTLMNNNPHYITKEDLGFASDGTTPLYAYHFREPEPHQNGKKGSEKKPVILICSGIHPTERAGEWSMYYALEEITNNIDLDDLRRNVHFIIMPLINPTAVNDSTWGVRNPDGIQTHYQFEVDFNKGNASPGERNYGGEQPLTIPESIAFDNLMKTYKKDLAIVMSCHNCDVDTQRGTDFIWCSCPTNFATNLGYRLADKMSKAWHKKHGIAFEEGVIWANNYALQKASEGSSIFNPTYIKERPSWDWRVGQAGLSGSGGTEYKQALKYGVQGINVEVCARNMVMDKNWSSQWSSNVMTWGCETYVNFFRIFMAVYDYKDKEQYYKK